MAKITDLTNTTWEIPAGWSASAGYGSFILNGGTHTGGAIVVNEVEYLGIEIGYYRWVDDGIVHGGAQEGFINCMAFSGFPARGLDRNSSLTISFIKGEDYETYGNTIFTNTQLISWLEANGILRGGEPEQTDTKPIYKRVNGAWVKLTAFERVNGAWVKISSAGEEPEQPQDTNFLTFSSPSSFTIGVVDNKKYWNGTLEYSTDSYNWNTWAGTSAISSSADGKLYLRGVGNTYITGYSSSSTKTYWVLTGSNISCSGNIETLLDYATVANGEHPTMTNRCYRYMFYGCTSLTTAPELPATTLADYCYQYMFEGCTNLATLPTLPATTLTIGCYTSMFNGCTQIKLSTTQTGDYQTAYRIPTSGSGTTATNALTNMFARIGVTFTSTPSINTTYYTSNTVV